MDRGAGWATVHGVAKSWTRLSDFHFLTVLRASQEALVLTNPPASAGDRDRSYLWLGKSLGGGHGKAFQYSCLKNPMDRGAGWATVHGVTKSWTQLKQLSTVALY